MEAAGACQIVGKVRFLGRAPRQAPPAPSLTATLKLSALS